MTKFGYTLMTEINDPRTLVRNAVRAEAAGFDFAVISDHFHPWLESQGHSPFAWSVLGAVADRTERMELMTMVTCPTHRYHPAIIAQAAATIQYMSQGRFTLGVGSGENLNEHVVGQGWPSPEVRQDMLVEALEVIRLLWEGGVKEYHGDFFSLQEARLYTLPEFPPPIAVAAGGPRAAGEAGKFGDGLIATEPKADLVRAFHASGGAGRPVYGQLPVCWGEDEKAARKAAHERFRFGVLGWKVQSELPGPVNFEAASKFVSEEDVAELVPSGPDPERTVDALQKFIDAGFDHVALLQADPTKEDGFLHWWTNEVAPRLRG